MSQPIITVIIYFGTSTTGGSVFTLDDPTKGLLDSSTYLLGGDTGTDVSAYAVSGSIDRGRPSLIFDDVNAGVCRIMFNNETRIFDPLYTSGPYYGNLKPGKRVTVKADGVTIFDGRVSDWNLEFGVNGRATAELVAEDALATLARKFFDAWTTTASQTAGTRLTSVLNRAEVAWPGGQRDLDTGISVLQADSVTWGSNVLNYCQLVARSDGPAAFFASRTGVLTFRDRHANLTGAPVVTFSDANDTGIRAQGLSIQTGSETYYTRVSVDREGGTVQSYSDPSTTTDDVITLSISGTLQDTDAQALDMATYYATVYATGQARISGVEAVVDSTLMSVDNKQALLGIELNDLVSITWTPRNITPALSETAVVTGIRHEFQPGQHTVSLALGKYDNRAPFILDSSTLDGGDVLVF